MSGPPIRIRLRFLVASLCDLGQWGPIGPAPAGGKEARGKGHGATPISPRGSAGNILGSWDRTGQDDI